MMVLLLVVPLAPVLALLRLAMAAAMQTALAMLWISASSDMGRCNGESACEQKHINDEAGLVGTQRCNSDFACDLLVILLVIYLTVLETALPLASCLLLLLNQEYAPL
jgi:hypothetical protein